VALQNPDKPLDDGRVRMPSVDAGMNRVMPRPTKASRAQKGGQKPITLKQTGGKDKRRQEDTEKFLAKVRKRFMRCVSAESQNRKEGMDDLKFKTGEGQWPPDVVSQRNFDRRPALTINKIPTFVNQVVNDQRMNRPAINISPVGDKGDPEVAKMYRGMIRAIERNSVADIAYDTGFDSAVSIGWGYWRVMTDYESPDSFNQVLVIKRIRNSFTVHLDPSRQEPDGSDAKFGFITELIPRKEFEDNWPHADPMPFTEGGFGEDYKMWVTEHEIRIAEYYEIAYEKRRLVMLENGHVGWFDELSDEGKSLEIVEDDERDFPTIKWYKVTGKDILEEQDWPGKWIPIVEVVGNETDIEGKVRRSGLIRNMKAPQLMYNYNRTLSVELSSLQPKAPWVAPEGSFEGYEQKWKDANIRPFPYLEYVPQTGQGGQPLPPPQRQPFQGAPQAVLAEVQAAAQDMQAVTGLRFDATQQERVYDESGRALRELRERGDLGSFHYTDNLARSLRHTGEILVDLIPKIYDTRRVLTILREDDSEEQVMVDPNAEKPHGKGQHPATGKQLKIFNPTYGKYGVTVTIGPSYATKRIEAAESMMDFVRAVGPIAPQQVANITDLIAKNLDWQDADQVAARLAKMLPPNLLAPSVEGVPPEVQAMLQSLQQQVQALNNEKMQLTKALTDQNADRALIADKTEKEFEAKLMNIFATFEAKMGAIQQKSDQAAMQHIGTPIVDLANSVKELHAALAAPEPEAVE